MAAHDDNAYFGADQSLDEAMASLDRERRRVTESSQARKQERTVVQAKDHSFTMTFDGRGDLVEMAFIGTKYRSQAPTALAHLIVTTMQRGRLEAIEKMAASMQSPALAGVDLVGIATGTADPAKVVDALLAPILAGVNGAGRSSSGGSRG